jgi:hypothetical protein
MVRASTISTELARKTDTNRTMLALRIPAASKSRCQALVTGWHGAFEQLDALGLRVDAPRHVDQGRRQA